MSNGFQNGTADLRADLSSDLAALRGDVSLLAQRVGELAQHGKNDARARVVEAASDAHAKINASAANAETRIRVAGADLVASIDRNPIMALAIAFGIGIGFGAFNRARN
jgi:ElaB/YqjD/DUF883 family membrane-anchored ribosome-binding protein